MLEVKHYVVEPTDRLATALREDCFSILLHKELWSIQEHDKSPVDEPARQEQVAIAHLGYFRRVYTSILQEQGGEARAPVPLEDLTLSSFSRYFKMEDLGPATEVEVVLSELGSAEIERIVHVPARR